jgi:hypothetical protein
VAERCFELTQQRRFFFGRCKDAWWLLQRPLAPGRGHDCPSSASYAMTRAASKADLTGVDHIKGHEDCIES